jgi:hypothetical protein
MVALLGVDGMVNIDRAGGHVGGPDEEEAVAFVMGSNGDLGDTSLVWFQPETESSHPSWYLSFSGPYKTPGMDSSNVLCCRCHCCHGCYWYPNPKG